MNDPHYGQIFLQTGPVTHLQWFVCAFTRSPAFHTGMGIGNGLVISATPQGVRIEPEEHYPGAIWSQFPLHEVQADGAVEWVRLREGRPYNWIDDALIGIEAVTSFRFPRWFANHWAKDRFYQCAQLVDAAYRHGADYAIFTDGRHPGSVSPGALAAVFEINGWWRHDWSAHQHLTANKFT